MAGEPGENAGLILSQAVWRRLPDFPKCGQVGKESVNSTIELSTK